MIRTNCWPLRKLVKTMVFNRSQLRYSLREWVILLLANMHTNPGWQKESVKVVTVTPGTGVHMLGMIRPQMGLAWP